MAITYIEKGPGLHDAIFAAGHWLKDSGRVGDANRWIASDEAAVQTIIDGYNPLAYDKKVKIAQIKADGLARIRTVFPAITDFEALALVRDQFLSVAPAARQPTANLQKMIDIYVAGANAIGSVNAATTSAQVAVIVPAWPA